jgi:hypothetical protein
MRPVRPSGLLFYLGYPLSPPLPNALPVALDLGYNLATYTP